LGFAATLVAADPFAGTWELNVAKSKYKTGAPNKEGTIVITESGSDLDVSTTATSADGAPISAHYTVAAKGRRQNYLWAMGGRFPRSAPALIRG
jgi:hypothetical protein